MSLDYLGSLTIGGCVPAAATAVAALTVTINGVLPEFQARLAAAVEAQAKLLVSPPTFGATLAAAGQLVVLLQAQGSLPGVEMSLTVVAAVIAALEGLIGSLEAQLAFAAALGLTLGTGGVHAYSYTGRADGLGPALAAVTAGGFPSGGGAAASTGAIVLAGTVPETRAAMALAFGVNIGG
jgi:hypothetical protein